MKNKKIRLLIFISIIFSVLSGIYFLFTYWNKQSNELSTKCPGYNGDWFGEIETEDCIGYLNIQRSHLCGELGERKRCNYTYVYDTLNNGEIIHKIDSYKIKDRQLYVVGTLSSIYFEDEKVYSTIVRINGEDKVNVYKNKEEMPKYFIVNSDNSDMILYKDYSQMPPETQQIFREIEKAIE